MLSVDNMEKEAASLISSMLDVANKCTVLPSEIIVMPASLCYLALSSFVSHPFTTICSAMSWLQWETLR